MLLDQLDRHEGISHLLLALVIDTNSSDYARRRNADYDSSAVTTPLPKSALRRRA